MYKYKILRKIANYIKLNLKNEGYNKIPNTNETFIKDNPQIKYKNSANCACRTMKQTYDSGKR